MFIAGRFHEHSDTLGLDLFITFLAQDKEQFNDKLLQLKNDVQQAGLDWTGTLIIGPEKVYFELDKDNFANLITNQMVVDTPTFNNWVSSGFVVTESPRKTWSGGK